MLPRTLPPSPRRRAQTGGIMILVALMLLVFLTLAAAGMTRNSFKEIVTSGTTRQAVLARNAADSGVEWTLLWMYAENMPQASTPSAQGATNLIQTLLQNDSLSGTYYLFGTTPGSPLPYQGPGTQSMPSDLTIQNAGGVSDGFTIALMSMGKLPVKGISQGTNAGQFRPAAESDNPYAPDLLAVRSDGQTTYGNMTFRQSREAWISTPLRFSK